MESRSRTVQFLLEPCAEVKLIQLKCPVTVH